MPSVLFVCTHNSFRSPLAAACFLHELKKTKKEGKWIVDSAGTWTIEGSTTAPGAIQYAHNLGITLQENKTTLIDKALLLKYDLILVMESGHKEALFIEFPMLRNHIYLLSEVVDGVQYDIVDPIIDASMEFDIADEINNLIQRGFIKICKLARKMNRINRSD